MPLRDDELLGYRIRDLGVRIEGSELEPRVAKLYGELEARGLRLRPPLLPGRRVVQPRRRAGHRRPVLSREPAAQTARAAPDDGSRGRHPRMVRAALAARVRARVRSRVSVFVAPQVARDLRQSGRGLRAGDLPAAPVQQRLRAPPAQLVRAGASRRGLRRDLRRLADHARRGVARALPRVEGAREARVRRRADARGAAEAAARARRPAAGRRVEDALDPGALLRRTPEALGAGPARSSTTPTCGASSPRRRRGTGPRRRSCAGATRPSSRAWCAGPDSASTWSTTSRASSSSAASSSSLHAPSDEVALALDVGAYLGSLLTNHLHTGRFKRSV